MQRFFSKRSHLAVTPSIQSFSSVISEGDSFEQQRRFSVAFAGEFYEDEYPHSSNRYSFSSVPVEDNYSLPSSKSASEDSKLFNPTHTAIKFFCEKFENNHYSIRQNMPLQHQFTGSLSIKKCKKLATKNGEAYEWIMELNEFEGNATWLLSHQHKKFYRIEVNNLLAETEKENFRQRLNSILEVQENIPERLLHLFDHLEHLTDAVHPFTGERMSLSIVTQYDKNRTENPKNNEKTLYFSFILSKLMQQQDLSQENLRF